MKAKTVYFAILASAMIVPQTVFAQSLPWKTQSSAPAAQPAPTRHYSNPPAAAAPASAPAMGEDTRDADDRKLAELAARFYKLHEEDKDAIAKMKKLEAEVARFKASLKGKSYDADILKDTRSLLSRMTHQRKEWEARKKVS